MSLNVYTGNDSTKLARYLSKLLAKNTSVSCEDTVEVRFQSLRFWLNMERCEWLTGQTNPRERFCALIGSGR